MNLMPQLASRRNSFRRARGGAMVEFVLLNLILIPLFLYAIFLMDAAYLKLDLQETVVSGVWDFSQRNNEPPGWGGVGSVGAAESDRDTNNAAELQGAMRAVRVVYADHTSAYDDGADPDISEGYGDPNYLKGNGDGSGYPSLKGHMKHHTGFGAQYSFRFDKGPDTQFMCTISSDMGWNPDPSMKGFANSGYNAGGEARCEATGFIYNYIIPQTFLQEFSKVQVTQMKLRKNTTAAGVHEFQGTEGNLADIFANEVASISFNTWALRNGATNKFKQVTTFDGKNVKVSTYQSDADGELAKADVRAPQAGIPMPQSQGSPEGNPFYRRVQYVGMSGEAALTYGNVALKATQFLNKASSEKVMLNAALILEVDAPPGVQTNAILPSIIGTHLTARYDKNDYSKRTQATPGWFGGKKYQDTPYDKPNNEYKSAADARGVYYLGCKNPENPDCF